MVAPVNAKSLLPFAGLFALPLLIISGCGGGKQAVSAQPVTIVPVSVSVTVKPTAVLPGQGATLTWSTSGASSCSADGAWSGPQQVNGSINVVLSTSTAQTFSLECISSTGQATRSTATLSLSPADGACTPNHALTMSRGKRAGRRHVLNGAHS